MNITITPPIRCMRHALGESSQMRSRMPDFGCSKSQKDAASTSDSWVQPSFWSFMLQVSWLPAR